MNINAARVAGRSCKIFTVLWCAAYLRRTKLERSPDDSIVLLDIDTIKVASLRSDVMYQTPLHLAMKETQWWIDAFFSFLFYEVMGIPGSRPDRKELISFIFNRSLTILTSACVKLW